MEITRALARFLVQSRYADIPVAVRHEAVRALLNWTGCAIGGAGHETVDRALAALSPFTGAAQASLPGRAERLDILQAALINGISSHLLDFDDTHARAIHPSAPVLPAVLAYAEWQKISGADFLHAFILGVEAECRVGLSVYPEHHDLGWHITGTAGTFGAAAAVGKLLNLDEQQMCWALGIAATQAAGLQEVFGSMSKSLHPGRAAQNGLTAALLAKQGFTSSEHGIEAPRGFAHVLSTKFDPDAITGDLGRRYELASNMYKPYPCGLVVHAAIDGCIELRREHGIRPEDIASVMLTVCPRTMQLTGLKNPQNGLESKFSVYHAAAVGLVFGMASEAQFSDAVAGDPRVTALRERISTTIDEKLERTAAHVTVKMRDGRVLERPVPHALGTLARPMSDADLETKIRGLAQDVLPERQCTDIIEVCWTMGDLPDAGVLGRCAARVGAG